MATTGIFGTTRFTALAAGDVIPAVDISDTTQHAHGSLDSITVTNFFATIPVPVNITSASATAFAVGLAGATNPAFQVDASTALQAAGLKLTGAVAAGTVALAVISSGGAANLTLNAKGTGTIGIGSVSTGAVTITPACTITGVLTLTAGATLTGATMTGAPTWSSAQVFPQISVGSYTPLVASLGKDATGGLIISGATGSSTDVTMLNKNGVTILTVPTGTTQINVVGGIDLTGNPPTAAASHVAIGGSVQSTIGANGAASALTANPLGYLKINVAGTSAIIPYYSA